MGRTPTYKTVKHPDGFTYKESVAPFGVICTLEKENFKHSWVKFNDRVLQTQYLNSTKQGYGKTKTKV